MAGSGPFLAAGGVPGKARVVSPQLVAGSPVETPTTTGLANSVGGPPATPPQHPIAVFVVFQLMQMLWMSQFVVAQSQHVVVYW